MGTKPVDSEQLEPTLTEVGGRTAVELALSSERVIRELEGKRYEIMGVGLRSLDKDTAYPLVVIYNYTDDVVVEAMVELEGRTLLEVRLERYRQPRDGPRLGATQEERLQGLDTHRAARLCHPNPHAPRGGP